MVETRVFLLTMHPGVMTHTHTHILRLCSGSKNIFFRLSRLPTLLVRLIATHTQRDIYRHTFTHLTHT